MVTTNEEQQVQTAENRTIGERMAAVEGKQDVLLDVLHENGRRSDDNYRALDAKIDSKIDALDAKFDAKVDALDTKFDTKIDALDARVNARIDRLLYYLLGIGGLIVVGIIVGIVSIVLQLVL